MRRITTAVCIQDISIILGVVLFGISILIVEKENIIFLSFSIMFFILGYLSYVSNNTDNSYKKKYGKIERLTGDIGNGEIRENFT